MFVSQMFRQTWRMFNVVPIPQANIKAGTSIGVDFDRELFLTITIVTDEDGIMKMKHVDGFADSKMELEFAKAVAEANANRQHVA